MAFYKNPLFLEKSNYQEFDKIYDSGETVAFSGIYRCEVCRREALVIKGNNLPAVDHHKHKAGEGHIKWRLIVATA